ncbi:hypothetical protein C8J57DRAFT_1459081 [Mycena rebaudengoi]|nr:hypothetical protein C8J57DRAFT_1459081 [Mycena rebaudengoi]
MTLAGEFDKELQRKYGNDLDTSLIFAGLFSAVSSAFIIQIQPELRSDTNTMLLMILVQNMSDTTLPGIQAPEQTPTIVVITQSLLYFSLFSTLFAALLIVNAIRPATPEAMANLTPMRQRIWQTARGEANSDGDVRNSVGLIEAADIVRKATDKEKIKGPDEHNPKPDANMARQVENENANQHKKARNNGGMRPQTHGIRDEGRRRKNTRETPKSNKEKRNSA